MSIRLPAPARREQILDVAVEVFARNGFHGASMNDVAEAAGVTKPVLYQHFDSKQDLYMALLDEVGNRLLTAITKATAGVAGGRQQTEQGFLAYFQWVADDHDAFLLLFGSRASRDEESTQRHPPHHRRCGRCNRPVDRRQHRCRPSPHPGARPGRSGRGRQSPTRRTGSIVRSARARPAGRRPRLGRPPRRSRLSARAHGAPSSAREFDA